MPLSGSVQLLLITVAPTAAAASLQSSRPSSMSELASSAISLQLGHTALAMSRSSAASSSQPWPSAVVFSGGSGDAEPSWLRMVRQPLADVHGGRP